MAKDGWSPLLPPLRVRQPVFPPSCGPDTLCHWPHVLLGWMYAIPYVEAPHPWTLTLFLWAVSVTQHNRELAGPGTLDSTRTSHHGPFQVEVSIVHLLTSSLNPWLPSRQDKENPYSAQYGNMSQVPTSTEQTEQSCGASVCSLRVCFPHTRPWPPWAFVLRVGVTRESFSL